jgi:hypothetical protein
MPSQPIEFAGSDNMTAAKLIEYRIARQLLRRREQRAAHGHGLPTSPAHWDTPKFDVQPWADRVIGILAVTTGLLLVGSYAEELLWAVLALATVYTLR